MPTVMGGHVNAFTTHGNAGDLGCPMAKGHHLRLYTLDSQVQHADQESLVNLGKWLQHKWHSARTRPRAEADRDIRGSVRTAAFLQEQWEEQVKAQTKPLSWQSKNKGKKAVEAALQTRKAREIAAKKVLNCQNILMDLEAEPYKHAGTELPDAEKQLESLRTSLRRQERALGVDGLLNDLPENRIFWQNPYRSGNTIASGAA
ncbi:hypothetical protein BDP27DRAFT_1429345 [Rhodocollybia butyracea]|uniref:Uncharacterized protein n=1 Tax=Rhodocollybia butyracea TaxID=206335 RepID=A0A9P5PF97_9AGAR|nr:hypothetical protein BDP27DRAFT_1429345 [Rhodocollybia butyracea]